MICPFAHSDRENMLFAVSHHRKSDIFIGHDWLKIHNLSINWQKLELEFNCCPLECSPHSFSNHPEEDLEDKLLEEGECLLAIDMEELMQIRTFQMLSSKLAEANASKEKKSFEQMVPQIYHNYQDVFEKDLFDKFLPKQEWDHAIELIPGTKPLDCKVYVLRPTKQAELDKFLNKNLKIGRIRPSKSPMASLFFFIKKKDRSLRPVQDYCKLNEMMVKN